MSSHVKPDGVESNGEGAGIRDLLRIRPVEIDDWSGVRYVHGNAFRTLVEPHVTPETAEVFLMSLTEPGYVDRLIDSDMVGAWFDGELVGTAGWRPAEGRPGVAQVEGLFVRPLFTFMGIGSTLLAHAEGRAREAGFAAFAMTVPAVSVPFLLRAGYEVAAHGADLPGAEHGEPMFLMRKREDACADDAADEPSQRGALLVGE